MHHYAQAEALTRQECLLPKQTLCIQLSMYLMICLTNPLFSLKKDMVKKRQIFCCSLSVLKWNISQTLKMIQFTVIRNKDWQADLIIK